MDQAERDALDRLASGEAVDPSELHADLRPLARAAQLLVTEGRAIEPPVGSLDRIRRRATAPRPRGLVWLRPAFAFATVVLLVLSLGGAAYASTPGEPLFALQRGLDDAYLTLPRSASGSASASLSVADRRVAQAASAAKKASPDALRVTLDDVLRYLARARADIARLPDGQRQLEQRNLAAFERGARDRLEESSQEANGENNNVLNGVQSALDRDADRDENDGQNGQNGPNGQNEGTRP